MSDGLFGFGPAWGAGSGLPGDGGQDPMGYLDPSQRQEAVRRWEIRAVQWRAAALAEAAFDGPVTPRLISGSAAGGIRGMVELEVPFSSLAEHREAEGRFLGLAARDEVLGPRRVVFVFRPVVAEEGETARDEATGSGAVEAA